MILMSFRSVGSGLIAVAATVLCTQVIAANLPIEFSAEVIQTDAKGQAVQGRMFVSADKVRSEFTQSGRTMVQIVDPVQQVLYVIFPEQQSYMEQRQPVRPNTVAEDFCAGMPPGMECKKLGGETLQNRAVEHYEVVGTQEGKSVRGSQWIDVERRIPLKIESPDGGKMELRLIGQETLQGRQVEKWEMVQSTPNTAAHSLFQWYDPALRLAIKEEMPGGFVRELRNIQIAPQDVQLFKLPQGYKLMPQTNPNPGTVPNSGAQPPATR